MSSAIQDHFQGEGPPIGKELPNFIKKAPTSPPASATAPRKAGIALDSLEPVIVSGVSSTSATTSGNNTATPGPNPNIPSPQNFAGSQKGLDLMQNGDVQTPRGDPQYVGLTKLTYQASDLKIAQSGSVEVCNQEDFNECFIEQTLNHYYKQSKQKSGNSPQGKGRRSSKTGRIVTDGGGDSSPERTGTTKQRGTTAADKSMGSPGQKRGNQLPKDDRKVTQHLLQQAKRTPYDFCKLSFVITLPYDMLIEQIQIQLPPVTDKVSSQDESQSQTDVKQQAKKQQQQTQQKTGNAMNIISSQASVASQETGVPTGSLSGDTSFSGNFKILNISSLKSPEIATSLGQSSESRHKKSTQSRRLREHRHVAIKSAFSEEVTGKNSIEVNLCAVTKFLHVTLLCLRQDIATVLQQWKQQSFNSSRKSKTTSAFEFAKQNAQQATTAQVNDPKVSGAQRLIAEIEDFDMLDEHDQEVAFISKQHYTDKGQDEIVDHEQIAMQLRGDDEEFDRDIYDEDLTGFKVGGMINNDEDDLRILDSLPGAVQPKVLTGSFNSKKQASNKQQKSGKDDQPQQQAVTVSGPLGHFFDKIVVYGFNANSIPAITNLTYFMNQSFYMRKSKKPYQAEEVDYLVGTLMVTTKRATQAGEYFRKMQAATINRSKRNISKLERSSRVSGEDQSSNNATFLIDQELRVETQNLFIECALYELVIADGLSFETQLNEKIQALYRLATFTEGQIPQPMRFAPQILVADDAFSGMLKVLPQLLRFCILSLTHRREIVRVSALKILKFILETQGCSLDTSMIYILKGMFLTYPKATSTQKQLAEKEEKLKKMSSLEDSPSAKSVSTHKAQEEPESATLKKANEQAGQIRVIKDDFDLAMLVGESEAVTMTIGDYVFCGQQSRTNWLLNSSANGAMMQNVSDSHVMVVDSEANLYATKFAEIVEPSSGFNTALQNVHSHVLETYISVLSSISSHILHRIFYDVIEDAICASPADSKKPQPKYSASFKQSMNSQHQFNATTATIQSQGLMAQASQIKVYACKIAEKIITICQGDLNISSNLLTSLMDTYSSTKPVLPIDGASNQAFASMKNLWSSIKQKVFPNYSTKGYRRLIEWISLKMDQMLTSPKTTPQDLLNTKPASQRADIFPDELSDEENIILCQLCEVVNIVSFNRLKQQEEANQLIKLPPAESFGNGPSAEMYILLPQLLFWLEYSIDREDRLQMFTQLYQTIKEVMESVPTNGRSKENQLSIVQIVMPSLRRTNEFLKQNSPSLPMLKFLDLTLTDIQLCAHDRKSKQQNLQLSPTSKQDDQETNQADNNSIADPLKLQVFFLEMLENFVGSLAYSLYEEAFIVFDKLLYLAGETITEPVIKKCIVALVDKYTLKSKSHKASLGAFMKTLMDVKVRRTISLNNSRAAPRGGTNTGPVSPEFDDYVDANDMSGSGHTGSYFEVMAEFCFFDNVDTNYKAGNKEGLARAIDDRADHNQLGLPQLVFRGPIDMHELFVDKLQFFIDSLALMTEAHIGMFTYLITNHCFKTMLLQILEHGETNVRMKAHEILEALTSYFVQCCPSKTVYEFPNGARDQNLLPDGSKKMEAEFIAHERLYISQIVIQVAKKSLQQNTDSYLQFNALILLDFLFQNLLPVPSFQNEQVKARKQNRRATAHSPSAEPTDVELTMDIEVLSISDVTPELDVMDPAYLRMRMKLVLSLWPHIQAALASPWSNIRSICYGLVCSMLKINVADYPSLAHDQQALSREFAQNPAQANLSEIMTDNAMSDDRNKEQLILSDILSMNAATQNRLKEIIIPMLYSLLSSKESESKAGGLNILGSFCGLSYDFSGVKINGNLAFLQRNSQFISLPIWRLVYQLQDDWDITIKEASVVLVQLCAPRNAILYFQSLKEKRQQKKLQYMMNQMPNIQSIYVKKGQAEAESNIRGQRPESRLKIKNFLIGRNEFAGRACARFPSEADKEIILSKPNNANKSSAQKEASFSLMQDSTLVNDGLGDHFGVFTDYLSGKIPIVTQTGGIESLFSQMAISCQMIEQENQLLSDKVHVYNPEYEDTRFAKNLSRKRQLEIELDMPSRGRKQTSNLNFFVDTYSDEQILEIISIFRNDFKPPKNLWIEKQPSPQSLVSGGVSNGAQMSQSQQANMRSQSPDYYQDIYAEAIEQFNQQQAQMQQQQQAQLQQQVQSGSSSPSSSRESSPLSNHSSEKSSPSPLPLVIGESAASTAARLSPQPSGRMIDALEDDQLRQYSEENKSKMSQNSSNSSVKSSQHNSHHGSIEDKSVHNFGDSNGSGDHHTRSPASKESKQGSGAWSPDTENLTVPLGHLGNGPVNNNGYTDEEQATHFNDHLLDDKNGGGAAVPYKSESMGLLDAEGYKFLEASDSNSDGQQQNEELDELQDNVAAHGRRGSGQPDQDLIYEMRPPIQRKKKSHKRDKPMKIEQLDFGNIQIFAQQPNPQPVVSAKPVQKKQQQNCQPKKPKQFVQQHQPQPNQIQQVEPVPLAQGNHIEFYPDPTVPNEQQAQSSSRLGQRSSRLQLQETYNQQQLRLEEEASAQYIATSQLLQKLKSPTDKIVGGGGGAAKGSGTFKSFNEQESRELRKNTGEQRKRKRSTTGPSSGQNQLRMRDMGTKKQLGKSNQLQLVENDYFSGDERHQMGNLTQKYQGAPNNWAWQGNPTGKLSGQNSTRHRAKSIGNANSLSTPEFNAIKNKLNQKVAINQTITGPQDGNLELSPSQEKIQRKMAQTYLSGLSKGYISNINNRKLLNNFLHQEAPQSTAAGSSRTGAASNSKTGNSVLLNKSLGNGGNNAQSSKQTKKVMNKSYENLGGQPKLKQSNNNGSLVVDLQLPRTQMSMMPQTQRSQRGRGKNSTLSASPKKRDGSAGSGSYRHRKQKHSIDKSLGKKNKQLNNQRQTSSDSKGMSHGLLGTSSGSHRKVGSGQVSDLHQFIEMMEIDLTEQYRGQGVYEAATPSQIRRQVEDQMRLFGLDPKSGNNQAAAQALALKFSQTETNSAGNNQHSQEKKRKKSLPPKLKLNGLNQVFHGSGMAATQDLNSAAQYNSNITPSNISSNGSGSHFMAKSHLNIHTANQFSGSTTKKYNDGGDRRSSGSRPRKRSGGHRDRSGESHTSRQRTKSGRLSTGRGASSGSGGRAGGAISHQIPHPPMVMTERLSRPARPATGGKTSQEKTHIKNSKSFTKGHVSALTKIKGPGLQKTSKQNAFSPPQHQSHNNNNSSLVQHQYQQPHAAADGKPSKPSSKGIRLNKSQNKGGSNSAMNHQIVTSRQTNKHLLQQLVGAGGSTSVRNSDYATTSGGSKGGNTQKGGISQVGSPTFFSGPGPSGNKSGQAKVTPGSTKGSQTNRFQANLSNNIMYELLQQQQQKQASKKNGKKHSNDLQNVYLGALQDSFQQNNN